MAVAFVVVVALGQAEVLISNSPCSRCSLGIVEHGGVLPLGGIGWRGFEGVEVVPEDVDPHETPAAELDAAKLAGADEPMHRSRRDTDAAGRSSDVEGIDAVVRGVSHVVACSC
jgi:hypothetical protein